MTGKFLLAPLLALALAPAAIAAVFNVNFESMPVPGNILVDATPDPEPAVNTLPNLSTNWNGTNLGNRVMTGFTDAGNPFGTGKVGVITDTNGSAGSQLNFEYGGNPTQTGKMVVSFDAMFASGSQFQNMWVQFVNQSGQVIFQMMSAPATSTHHTVYLFEYDTPGDTTPTQFNCGNQPYSTSQTWRFEIDLTANNAVLKINGVALTANAGAKTSWAIDAATYFGGTRFLTGNASTRTLAIDNFSQQVEATGLTIFSGGTTTYTIYHAPGAPKCVADAALDLKNVILAATNPDVTVNIVTASVPTTPMICLGVNTPATNAGATVTAAMADGGFRIKTVGSNLYILGVDTPQNQKTALGGFLRGTRDGVSYLWETYLNARYLLPGPDGLDVPIATSMVVPAQDTIKLPGFPGRDFDYIGQTPMATGGLDPVTPNEIDKWMHRNRVGKSIDVDRGHTWSDYPSSSPGALQAAWMAISTNNGVNRDPTNTVPRKYCTTNTSLQDAYAVKLNSVLNTETTRTSVSMSPTDGVGGCYCTSPNCKAHITIGATPVDFQGFGVTRTRQILKWYGDVGGKFFTSYPLHANKRLGGYIYNEYNLPPTGAAIPLHANIELYYAPRHWYGMMLFKNTAMDQFELDVAAWAAKYPNQLSYSDYPMWGNYPYSGTPLSPGLDQLDRIVAALDLANARHLIFNSNSAWGWVGLKHYCLARKMWDPTLSMAALKTEYLTRCYGDGASDIQTIYDTLDSSWSNYITTRPQTPNIPDWMTDITDAMIAATCGPNWTTFESKYFAARTAINNSSHPNKTAQLNRLKMFGKNLAVLHYRLRHKGNPGMNTTAYNDGNGSGFYMDDTTFTTWRGTYTNDIALEKNWNNGTTGIGTYKDFVYNITHDDLSYAPGTKVAVPTSTTVGGNRFNAAAGHNGTGGAQLWADYKDSVNNGTPTIKNQVVFTCAAGGTVPSASVTGGEHDCAVLGVKEFKAKLWVDSGGSVANVVNFIFLDQGTNKNVGIFRLNLATNKVEALPYTAPNVTTGIWASAYTYTRGTLIDVVAKIHFDPASPRIEYFVNNGTSTPNATVALPKWAEIRKINIAATGSTVGKVAIDDVSFGP
jgi:hypothetical protein